MTGRTPRRYIVAFKRGDDVFYLVGQFREWSTNREDAYRFNSLGRVRLVCKGIAGAYWERE